METEFLVQAKKEALKTIAACTNPAFGIKASARVEDYNHVWGRDSMITALGILATGDKKGVAALKATFVTLARYQSDKGCIPNCVYIATKKPNYRAYADGNAWFVVGNYAFWKATGDESQMRQNYQNIKRALTFLNYQESDHSDLISMQEGGDWMDMFSIRGKGLCINVLHAAAFLCASDIAKKLGDRQTSAEYEAKAHRVKDAIQQNFWIRAPENFRVEKIIDGPGYAKHGFFLQRKSKPYFLPYLTFSEYGEWFDSLANLLAIIFGIADRDQSKLILDYIAQAGVARPYSIRAVYPAVLPGQRDWRDYFLKDNLNAPWQYHNGGIWPFIGGFYVAALVKARRFVEAERELALLAEVNRQGKEKAWEFNEWCHGETGKPMGMVKQGWSAGMFLYACEAVEKRKTPYLKSFMK